MPCEDIALDVAPGRVNEGPERETKEVTGDDPIVDRGSWCCEDEAADIMVEENICGLDETEMIEVSSNVNAALSVWERISIDEDLGPSREETTNEEKVDIAIVFGEECESSADVEELNDVIGEVYVFDVGCNVAIGP